MLAISLIAFVILQCYTALMIILRGKLFHTKVYRPMLWNLFLSLAPLLLQIVAFIILLLIAGLIIQIDEPSRIVTFALQGFIILGILVWAAFFPNATYLITELNFSHRKKDDPVPEYYDIVMVFTLAATGVINALASLAFFHFLLLFISAPEKGIIPLFTWLIIATYAFASSFAIYIGREIRLNSWDLLHPISLFKKLKSHFGTKLNIRRAAGYTIFFSGILLICHIMVFPVIYMAIVH